MATNTTESSSGDEDWVPPERLARKRVDAWSRLSKQGDPIRLPGLGQPGFGRTVKQVFDVLVGMLDRQCPTGPLTGERGVGPTQQSIATLTGVGVRWVREAEDWLANPITVCVPVQREVKQRGKPTVKETVTRDVPADPRGRRLPGSKVRVPWTESDGLRTWPPFIQVFDAQVIPGGGGGRRRRICVHPLFHAVAPAAFKACLKLPAWPGVDITKHDVITPEGQQPTRDELVEMCFHDHKLVLINGELSSSFQTAHYLGEIDE